MKTQDLENSTRACAIDLGNIAAIFLKYAETRSITRTSPSIFLANTLLGTNWGTFAPTTPEENDIVSKMAAAMNYNYVRNNLAHAIKNNLPTIKKLLPEIELGDVDEIIAVIKNAGLIEVDNSGKIILTKTGISLMQQIV